MNARTVLSTALGALAVTVLMSAAAPARADGDDWRWRRHEWREHGWREHAWREHEWREHHWHPVYRPYVVAPPPAYYAPPPAYRYGW